MCVLSHGESYVFKIRNYFIRWVFARSVLFRFRSRFWGSFRRKFFAHIMHLLIHVERKVARNITRALARIVAHLFHFCARVMSALVVEWKIGHKDKAL